MAHELEGNPQKPSGTAVLISKRRIDADSSPVKSAAGLKPHLMQGKVEDSGAAQGKNAVVTTMASI